MRSSVFVESVKSIDPIVSVESIGFAESASRQILLNSINGFDLKDSINFADAIYSIHSFYRRLRLYRFSGPTLNSLDFIDSIPFHGP